MLTQATFGWARFRDLHLGPACDRGARCMPVGRRRSSEAVGRPLERGLRQRVIDGLSPDRQKLGGVSGNAGRDHLVIYIVALEHLTCVRTSDVVDRTLHAPMAFLGAVAETDRPLGGVAQVIGALLAGLRGNARRLAVLAAGQSLPQGHHEGRMTLSSPRACSRRNRRSAARQLHISGIRACRAKGEMVLVASVAADGDGVAVERGACPIRSRLCWTGQCPPPAWARGSTTR